MLVLEIWTCPAVVGVRQEIKYNEIKRPVVKNPPIKLLPVLYEKKTLRNYFVTRFYTKVNLFIYFIYFVVYLHLLFRKSNSIYKYDL